MRVSSHDAHLVRRLAENAGRTEKRTQTSSIQLPSMPFLSRTSPRSMLMAMQSTIGMSEARQQRMQLRSPPLLFFPWCSKDEIRHQTQSEIRETAESAEFPLAHILRQECFTPIQADKLPRCRILFWRCSKHCSNNWQDKRHKRSVAVSTICPRLWRLQRTSV